ncbi:restriction endonuclease-like protein [Vreelandella zhaodongensis]|uniref:DUF2357 domain-containing protein n=1 Tax=Vreelandella zhaodongensis TaxID=1176240 RepID=A0ABX2SQW9_VREZH|nr:restriction endonuclease-like protein [Halomonas zhaodongensis]NYS44495.1 DUF2357 domain-containing protein [Halomonas zhaodongensis]
MPELLRIQTPDFEFSVWTNDISARAKVYQDTVAKRASLTVRHGVEPTPEPIPPKPALRFAPEAKLVDIAIIDDKHHCLELDNSLIQAQDVLVSDVVSPEKRATLSLHSPLFFENTLYQFEWVFFGAVSNARLVHRSQSVSEAFRFAAQRGPLPARLTGTINTGNDVGWMRLPLSFEIDGKTHSQHISFEVLPTKIALHQDLPAMYQEIDAVYPLWRFSLVEKTDQDAASSKQRGHFPLMWLANFAALRERFEQGLKVICAAPHSRLQPTVVNIKAAKLKGRLPYRLTEQVKQDFANGQYDKRYRIEKKQLSVDTPENRFIKMAVNRCKRQLAEFEATLRASNQAPERQRLSESFLIELHSWQQPLQKVLNRSFLKDVGAYGGLSRESLVLQQKTGYSAVYRVWQELKFYLDVFGNQSSISMKSVAEIYEVWCFLCLKQILERDLGFELISNSVATLSQNEFFEYQLEDGFAGAFRFQRDDGVTAKLAHEPKFTKKGKSIRSYLVNQEPDIVLEVTLPKSNDSHTKKKFIWLFDAKYRIKTDKNRFDSNEENIAEIDYVPDDAINQMHRYRDALIRLSTPDNKTQKSNDYTASKHYKKSRPVFGAFALYPGFFDQTQETNPYANAIEEVGIGAFALLPSQTASNYCGHQWLLEFLQTQIGNSPSTQPGKTNEAMYPVAGMVERLYVQEAARIPYYGMRQMLYSDLTLTAALGPQKGRDESYLERFENGAAKWYHIKQEAIRQLEGQIGTHIVDEIRYLALASPSQQYPNTKQIDKVWPIKRVSLLPRYAITKEQAGVTSKKDSLYYLFELGKPLTLQLAVSHVPLRNFSHSMKLTTLSRLENVIRFSDVDEVYKKVAV